MKKLILVFAFLSGGLIALAQTQTVSGTVYDETGPLPGVNVIVKGTAIGTQTDFDGKYEINLEFGNTLVFNAIGYKTREVIVQGTLRLDVVMEEEVHALEEVVIVGYGRQQRKAVTHAVSEVVSESQIKIRKQKAYHQTLERQLQGKAAGVNIMSSGKNSSKLEGLLSGPGYGNNGRYPLYIVDGIPVQKQYNSIIANLSMSEIAKINRYKGAKARELFGRTAKNGCIVITTKKGNYQIENDEFYSKITENRFKRVKLNPLSTFSIDVDKAAYSNLRRMINNGASVPVDAVKIEEMINYFDYTYPQPHDEHPFSINAELAQTPWNWDTQLVRIGLQGKDYTSLELPAANLTFLIDVSGSMNAPNKLPLLKSALKLLINQLREKDKVAIVVYAGAAGVVLKPTKGTDKTKIFQALDQLEAGGSTAGGEGIELAYSLAEKNFRKNGNNRVVLATDGDFNVGASSDRAMEKLIEEKRKSGVFLSVLGFGMGNYKDSKLEILADKGNGNHAYIDTMQEAQKVFGKEFGGTLFTIAKDVKIQVEFNPLKVQAYRLLGYENRLLADEDFIDDTKDAGELGSGHMVTALYEIIPNGISSQYLKEVPELKYTDPKSKPRYSEDLLTIKLRYKRPNGNTSVEMTKVLEDQVTVMSPDFGFASAVALFGMQLRKSQYTNGTNSSAVLDLAGKSRGEDRQGYRAEFVRLVKTFDGSL